MAILLPVLFSYAMLGIVFDYRNYQKTYFEIYGDLYKTSQIENNEEYSSKYKVIESPRDVRDFYNIDARLSLNMKVFGSGSFISDLIKNSLNQKNNVEIQIYIRYQKSIVRIPEGRKLSDSLNISRIKQAGGTHFIKTTRNGAIMQITLLFPCQSYEQKTEVLGTILKHVKKSGTFNNTFIENLKNVKKELGSNYPGFYFRQRYCSGCRFFLGDNLNVILKQAENLSEIIKDNGVPLNMELEDLSTVIDYPPFEENKEILDKLDEIEEMYDDIKIARREYNYWDEKLPLDLPEEQSEMLHQFYSDIVKAEREFSKAIIELDISPSASVKQFDKAYDAYGSHEHHDHFQRRLRELKEKVKINE